MTTTDSPLALGKVFLLGAGPGAVQYLTLQAQHCLQGADVLIYDALTDDRLQGQVREQCQLIQVGKRGGQPSTPQTVINQLLVEQCQRGKQVVRLKSGDPFIFGRAMAEIQALQAANCPFEVIPGLSSALAAPLLAGIPLTDPVLSRGFGVFTAHDLEALNWEALAQLPTLVLLMGGQKLPQIVGQLLGHGRSPYSPIAIIRWAGQPEQEVIASTLEEIGKRLAEQGIGQLSPCVIVVGEVVSLREFLR
jgi:uroporphyrin-III C-methyltransferase